MHKMGYHSIENLVFDDSFKKWVLNTADKEDTLFWEYWVSMNPDKYELLNSAKAIIFSLIVKQEIISANEVETAVNKILDAITTEETKELSVVQNESFTSPLSTRWNYWQWLKVAAVTLIVISTGAYFYQSSIKSAASSYNDFYSANEKSIVEFSNNTNAFQTVNLPDGSTAKLSAQSRLSYTLNRDSINNFNKREVFLEGECFFSVHKNSAEPFVVYTNSFVTKVLGTSFKIRAYNDNTDASIEVRTGKVSVYKKEDFKKETIRPNELGGLLLLPNQQVIYNAKKSDLHKSLVDEPVVISHKGNDTYNFDAVPYKDVFKKLEQDYGIKIIYDEESVLNCTLTATLGNEGFNDKIKLICKCINAKYEPIDGNIVVYAVGCK